MPFKIIRNDITKMETDAIVNTANPYPTVGDGSDANVYKAAGVEQLLAARKELGKIERGEAVFTEGFGLPAKYIIHTVGPRWKGGSYGEEEQLRNCYRNSLEIALELNCRSVAFPLISAGNYGYPKDKALNIALSEINHFLMTTDFSDPFGEEEYVDMDVYLVIYDEEVFELSSKIDADIQSYIDENYIEENQDNESLLYGKELKEVKSLEAVTNFEIQENRTAAVESVFNEEEPSTLEDMLNSKQDSFQDILMHHIAVKNLDKVDVYKKANIDAKFFSKIICKKNYVPKKKNVMALDEYELESEGFYLTGPTEGNTSGNGSLMRFAPVPYVLYKNYGVNALEKKENQEFVYNMSAITHASRQSKGYCLIYTALMLAVLEGCKKEELMKRAKELLEKSGAEYEKDARILDEDFGKLPEEEIKSTGYIVHSLEAAVWSFLNTDNFSDCVALTISLGKDTDTIAAIAGSFAAVYYGEINEEWKNTLRSPELLEEGFMDFCKIML